MTVALMLPTRTSAKTLVLVFILLDWCLTTGFSEKLNLPPHLFDRANERSKVNTRRLVGSQPDFL
jgi:hypothetical protein